MFNSLLISGLIHPYHLDDSIGSDGLSGEYISFTVFGMEILSANC